VKRCLAVLAPLLVSLLAVATPARAGEPTCGARIQRGGTFVGLTQREYRYSWRQTATGRRRVIVARDVPVRVACATRCVRVMAQDDALVPVVRYVRRKVTERRGNRLVRVSRRVGVYEFVACPVHEPLPVGTALRLTLQPGSALELDFGTFLRTVPLSGELDAVVTASDPLRRETHFAVRSGALDLAPTGIFLSNECGAVLPELTLATPGVAAPAGDREHPGTVLADDSTLLTLRLEFHIATTMSDDVAPCQQPPRTYGATTSTLDLSLLGRLDGEQAAMTSSTVNWDLSVCFDKGPPDTACTGRPVPLPVRTTAKLALRVTRA
jgi:hypothetical protein